MRDYKEIWCELHNEFEEERGREPTSDEMRDLWGDYCQDLIDCYDES